MSPRILPVALAAQLARSEERWLRHSAERLRARSLPLRRPRPIPGDPTSAGPTSAGHSQDTHDSRSTDAPEAGR